jgi:DNA-binding transcriptional LysR family regulator
MIKETHPKRQPDLQALPDITFRQLEVFCTVCHEKSFANAALELCKTRANVKKSCEDFEKAVARKLFDEADRMLTPTPFAQAMLGRTGPLARGLRRMEDGVKNLHQAGRVLRFAAAGEFFRGGLFTDFLSRVRIADVFRPCFLRIDSNRFRNALLNAECDVYFGVGLLESERMERVDLGPVPWKISRGGKPIKLTSLSELGKTPWGILEAGETGSAQALLDAFHFAGATGGSILSAPTESSKMLTLAPDTAIPLGDTHLAAWPSYRFTAVLRKHHPYSELKDRLIAAAIS